MAIDFTTTPPSAPDIERAVLSAMMFEDDALDTASEALTPDAFYRPEHMAIFSAICDMRISGVRVDQLTLCEELNKRGVLEKIGGEAVIAAISSGIGSMNITDHCAILNEKLAKRKLLTLSASVRSMCVDDGSDPEEIAATMYMQAVAVMDSKKEVSYRPMAQIVHDAHGWLMRKSNATGPMGIPTGIKSLDRYLDGWQNGNLYILAGKTGQGKSALAENCFALKSAMNGTPTAIFSLEMNDVQIGVRMVSGMARMDLSDIQYKKPTQDEWSKISESCARLSQIPLYVDDTPGISIAQIGAKVRRLQREKDVKLVIVDYLQLMEGKKTNSREQEVASISRGLKLLSKSLDIPIVALSQLSRKADQSESVRPSVSWLRESGSLEHDSDGIVFIWNPTDAQKQEHGATVDLSNIREIIIAKNRGGKVGIVPVIWKPEHVSFYDIDHGGNF